MTGVISINNLNYRYIEIVEDNCIEICGDGVSFN